LQEKERRNNEDGNISPRALLSFFFTKMKEKEKIV
jgi:hypothetical protein